MARSMPGMILLVLDMGVFCLFSGAKIQFFLKFAKCFRFEGVRWRVWDEG